MVKICPVLRFSLLLPFLQKSNWKLSSLNIILLRCTGRLHIYNRLKILCIFDGCHSHFLVSSARDSTVLCVISLSITGNEKNGVLCLGKFFFMVAALDLTLFTAIPWQISICPLYQLFLWHIFCILSECHTCWKHLQKSVYATTIFRFSSSESKTMLWNARATWSKPIMQYNCWNSTLLWILLLRVPSRILMCEASTIGQ